MSEETDVKPCYKCKHIFDAKAPECPKCQFYDIERIYDIPHWNTRRGRRIRNIKENVWSGFVILFVIFAIAVIGEAFY